MPSVVEAALARHRVLVLGALIVLAALAWAWLVSGAGTGMRPLVSLVPSSSGENSMPGMDMPGAMQPDAAPWTAGRFVLTLAMWWVMMVAMMLPSAAPVILLYARAAADGHPERRPATPSFLAGYLCAWGLFSLLATGLQFLLEAGGHLNAAAMAVRSPWLTGAVLVAAGIYQLSPVKDICLRHCRNPAVFLSRHFRPGSAGAWRMGLLHGFYCVGCCWMLMLLLFVGGVMNLAWIALLTLMVAAEKLLPFGRIVTIAGGLGCIAWGALLVF